MDVKIILKNLPKQKQLNIFLADIQMTMIWNFDSSEKKNDVYRDEGCMKKFRNKQQEFYEKTKICYISKKTFEHKYKQSNDKNYYQIKYHCHYTGKYRCAAHITCSLKYNIFNKVTVFFWDELNYDEKASKKVWRIICF